MHVIAVLSPVVMWLPVHRVRGLAQENPVEYVQGDFRSSEEKLLTVFLSFTDTELGRYDD